MDVNDFVVTAASVCGPNSIGEAVLHQERPMLGVVESLTPGAPPTAITVNWSDRKRTLYSTSGAGPTAVLYTTAPPVDLPLVGAVARPVSGSGIPNPGQRLQGPIVNQFILKDPSTDAEVVQIVVIETPLGYLVADFAQVEVVPSA